MRHTRIQQAKPERSFAERIVAVIVAIAMLGGMGYATTSAAMADDTEQTTEQQAGISLGLHDYKRSAINNNHALQFTNVGDPGTYNRYVGDRKGAYTGIVKTTLTNGTNGYPAMADDKGSESLDYLFGGRSDSAVKNYTPAGGLLTLGDDGYYGFDADSQYAAYNKTSNKFELSQQTYCADPTNAPCFTPFGNDTKENKYSFGMNLGADFYMPEGRQVNNQDMVFDFTGDDDVWVFIDGVLVLDLGGIHQALGGKINFHSGDITYDKPQSHGERPAATTIAEAFSKAGEQWDSAAYKKHHLSFFYLERGDGGSNCKIRFNLPVKPSKAIDIEKETLGTIGAGEQFQFQLFVNGSSTPYQGEYSVYDAHHINQVVQPDAQTGNNGVITLTKGQFARVQSKSKSFTDDTTYKVRELNSSGYTVFANDAPMKQWGSGDNASYAETDSFTVGETSHVTIVNSNVKPSNNKSIEKTIDGDGDEYTLHLTASGDSTSSAKIKVFSITDTLSRWVDLVEFAGCANGTDITQCVTVRNGNTELTGYTATYNSGNRTVTVTFNGTEGIVAEKADDIDVSFKVKPSDAAYADYAENNNIYPDTGDADTGDASAGQQGYYSNADAKLNYCVLIEVNNAGSCAPPTEAEYPHPVVQVKLGKINITKQWSDGADKHANDSVTVQLQRKAIDPADSPVENVGGLIPLNAKNKWAATVNNLLPGYTYSVVETPGDDQYDVEYKVNNTENNSVDLTKRMVWSSAGEGTLNATITNTRKTVSLNNAISVKKNLTGRKWKNSDQFSFTLEAEGAAPLPTSCKNQQPCTVTVKHDSDGYTKSFGDITYNAGNVKYTYYVTEKPGEITALHYSQARYRVVVSVSENAGTWGAAVESVTKMQDDNGETVSQPQGINKPVAFTNHYIAVSALPLTGGMTDRQWLFVGGVVGGLAVLLIGAAGVWNGKKRLV